MTCLLSLLTTLLTLAPVPAEEAFLQRVEQTEMIVNGKSIPRVVRNDAGEVILLHLRDMELSPQDFEALGKLTTLQKLNLFQTNTTNHDLQALRTLQHLTYLNLTSTEITDDSITELKKLSALQVICLGDVRMTPEGMSALKTHFPKLRYGYNQRKE